MTSLHQVPYANFGNPFASGLRIQAPASSSVKHKTPGSHRADKSFSRSSCAATHDTAVVETSASPAGEPLLIVWYCEWDEGRTNARMLAIIPLLQSV